MESVKPKKITRATVKSFIKKNKTNELCICVKSQFDGMIDGVCHNKDPKFKPVNKVEEKFINDYNQGISGVWLLTSGSSGNTIEAYNDGTYKGFSVYNCCRDFVIAVKI